MHVVFAVGMASPAWAADTDFPDIRKISCVGSADGCPCYAGPAAEISVAAVYHMQAVTATGREKDGFEEISVGGAACWHPSARLIEADYEPVLHSKFQDLDHSPVPLDRFLADLPAGESAQAYLERTNHVSLGLYWPTYYHLALEDFHPGPRADILSPEGKVLGRASGAFLEQVSWEGSGIASDGKRVRVSGVKGRYNLYPQTIWGYGAGGGHQVFPYRTIAVNYPALCEKLKGRIPDCDKEKAIGLMVFIPEIAEGKILMDGGGLHDGYFCAADTGSPNYIRGDRIDIFVGTHGGGNPYLPEPRRRNRLIDGGIESLVRSDWRLWKSENDRVWCEPENLPADPRHPQAGDCVHDYHVAAAEKALTLIALFDDAGRPVKCRKEAESPISTVK